MKSELSDAGLSNHSDDFSNDSHNSQISTVDFLANMGNGILLTPTNYITFEGLNSGVPTRTTPTLTPTTLRNIEQTFIELQSKSEPHENEAGFVPPLVHSIGNNQYISASEATSDTTIIPNLWHSSLSQSSSDCDTRSTPPLSLLSNNNNKTTTPSSGSGGQTRRNMGGRKPNKDFDCSPEEEERRRIRRERNKAAAARCRKRRVDHTNALIIETEELERKKVNLQDEIYELQNLKRDLEYLLENHKASSNCRKETSSPPEVKPPLFSHHNNNNNTNNNNNQYSNNHHQPQVSSSHMDFDDDDDDDNDDVVDDNNRVKTEYIEPSTTTQQNLNDVFHLPSPAARKVMLSSTVSICKPNRPNSLNVGGGHLQMPPKSAAELLGIPLSTPSTGMTFNFDSMMGGGTGLTPVSNPLVPSCSMQQQQRNLMHHHHMNGHHHHHQQLHNLPVSMADMVNASNAVSAGSPDACGPSSAKLVSL